MDDSVLFSRVMEEYGTQEKEKEEKVEDIKVAEKVTDTAIDKGANKSLMQEEERLTGSVGANVYARYLRSAGGLYHLPLILALLAGYQGSSGKQSSLSIVQHQLTPSSREQSVPGFLDLSDYPWLPQWRLYGGLRRVGYCNRRLLVGAELLHKVCTQHRPISCCG